SLRDDREAGVARLRELLLAAARKEAYRRAPRVRISGPELDDIAEQAATDASLAVLAKLDQFRGESRFTTWAYPVAVLGVSSKLGRHFWQTEGIRLDVEAWERLPDRFGLEPDRQAEWGELMAALRRAVDEQLTPYQRQLFVALVLEGVPL